MIVTRIRTLTRLVELCGADILHVTEPGRAWPAFAEVRLGANIQPVAVHVGPVGGSGRGRDAVERRFQNPGKGKPVQAPLDYFPLLIGVWSEEGSAILVGMDAIRRVGDETRKSLFVPRHVLREAQEIGWVEHTSASGETVIAFAPAYLRRYVTTRIEGCFQAVPAALEESIRQEVA